MSNWIEVRARYDKLMDNGAVKKVTEPYLADALSCTEAEARVTRELSPLISGDFRITKVEATKIAEIFFAPTCDRYYKVKVNFITIDERSGAEKRSPSYILVQASSFPDAFHRFTAGMKGTLADYEIESIAETKIMDVYCFQPDETPRPTDPATVPQPH